MTDKFPQDLKANNKSLFLHSQLKTPYDFAKFGIHNNHVRGYNVHYWSSYATYKQLKDNGLVTTKNECNYLQCWSKCFNRINALSCEPGLFVRYVERWGKQGLECTLTTF
jgi:hypothetical protein